MVAVQILTLIIILFFIFYLIKLLVLDLLILAVNAVLIYAVLMRMLRAFKEGFNRLYMAVSLVVLLVMFVFPFPNAPLYQITWFLVLVHLGSQGAWWAHKKKYVDLSDLVEYQIKKK